MAMKNTRLAILSAGGDCPGINSVIAAAHSAARAAKVQLIGIRKGYSGLSGEQIDRIPLREPELRQLMQKTKSSVLGMSRYSLFGHPDRANHAARLLKAEGITHLIAIGGDDTLRSTDQLASACGELGFKLGIVHCPKTIDNDFPFSDQNVQTFGFDTAASVVAQTITRIDQGASMLACVMGRYTGFLAAEGALRAKLPCCIVPELFGERRISLIDLCDITERAILAYPKTPIVFAEGLWEVLDAQSREYILSRLPSASGFQAFCDGTNASSSAVASADDHGHTEYGNFPWFELWANMMAQRSEAKIRYKLIGYETRIQAPNEYDEALTETIGAGAVELLLEGRSHVTVYGRKGPRVGRSVAPSFKVETIDFDKLPRDHKLKIQIRTLDVNHPHWRKLMSTSAELLK